MTCSLELNPLRTAIEFFFNTVFTQNYVPLYSPLAKNAPPPFNFALSLLP